MRAFKNKLILGAAVVVLALMIVALVSALVPPGKSYYISVNGSDSNGGLSNQDPLATISRALELAQPGDSVIINDGDYEESVITVRGGTKANPIVIKGSRRAVLRGGNFSRIFEINHDYIELIGFTIDGQKGSGSTRDDYYDKLVYVIGKTDNPSVDGVKVLDMSLKNAGGECLRMRSLTRDSEAAFNDIYRCGVYDYVFSEGGKNGEAIYIGTAPEQLNDKDNLFSGPDNSSGNFIHHNHIDTQGNECVDIKESAVNNRVEDNYCTGQTDPESGGISVRGDDNVIRRNRIVNNSGAGVRLGGDHPRQGVDNEVTDNHISGNQGYGLKVLRAPQGVICGNSIENNGGGEINDIEETAAISPGRPCE